MKFDEVMIYYLDLQCTLGEMFANTCACIDDFIKKKQHSASLYMYHILVCTYFILGEPAIIWSVV